MEQTPDPKPSPPFKIPVSDEELTKVPKWASSDARKEERKWDDLDQIKRNNDVRWLTTYGDVLVWVTWAFAGIFLASLLVWAWHYVGPACAWGIKFHWLNETQLSKVQSILFSGSMGAVVSGIVKSQLGKAQ